MAGTVKKLQFSEGTDVGAPTDLSLATSTTTISEYADDTAFVTANGAATAGDVYINSTLKVFRYYTGSSWRNAVPQMDPADPTKTFLIDITGNTTGVSATLTFTATAGRVYTFPDLSMTVASRAGSETLLNKTLTTPLITTNGSIDVTGAGTLAIGASMGANNLTLGGSTSTVVIAGNLTVSGTTTTVNSTVVDVADKNITVSKGGNDAASEGSGLTVDRTGTKGSFIYKAASASKFAIGPLGAELDVVDVSSTQSVSNKTITLSDFDGGTASNTSRLTLPKDTLANLTTLTRKAGTFVYDTTSTKPYYDDGSALKAIGSGSGSGGKNYCNDFSDGSTVGTVGTAIVTDTGNRASGLTAWQSTATANISISSSGTTPLRDTTSYLTTGSGNAAAGTTFIETPAWQLDTVDLGKALLVSFDVSGNTTAADWDCCMVRYNSGGTFQEKISVAGTASTGTPASAVIPTGTTTLRGFFVSSSTQTDYYALRFRRLAGTTNIRLDTLTVGPQSIGVGAASTQWEAFTPTTQGLGTISSNLSFFRREGGTMYLIVRFTVGTTTATEARVTLPNSLKLNTSFSSTFVVGRWERGTSTASSVKTGPIQVGDGTSNCTYINFTRDDYSTAASPGSPSNGDALFSSGEAVQLFASVPIDQWSTSNMAIADRSVEEYAYNTDTSNASSTTGFANGPGGVSFGSYTGGINKRVRFQTAMQPTDRIIIEVTADSGVHWLDQNAIGLGNLNYTQQGSNDYGMALGTAAINSTDVDVYFAKYRDSSNATYATAGGSWSGIAGAASIKWRVRKVSGGATVGYPVSSQNLIGRTDGVAPSAGYIGQVLSATFASNVTGSIANYASITLTAGSWWINASVTINNPVGNDWVGCFVSTTSASTAGTTLGVDKIYGAATSNGGSAFMTGKFVNISSSTTYYLNSQSSGTTNAGGQISAVRIA